jgi:hypothetical protein
MPSYNWLDYAERPVAERFPGWAVGSEAWRSFVAEILGQEEPSPGVLDDFRVSTGPILPVLACPRVFISHRQVDSASALRIAHLSTQEGLEFWLDILDPNLQALQQTTASLTVQQRALLTAGIIEMALMNSTHAKAVMTQETRGSLWVPYEYGRVKEAQAVSSRVGSWVHPNLAPKDFPEYMALGVVTYSEREIRQWFTGELLAWKGPFGTYPRGTNVPWTWGPTYPLPV